MIIASRDFKQGMIDNNGDRQAAQEYALERFQAEFDKEKGSYRLGKTLLQNGTEIMENH